MKRLLLVALLLPVLHPVFSQTAAQLTLIDKFFNKDGGNILQDAAHTGCTWSYASVTSPGEHVYRIALHYTQVLTSKEFSCEYRLRLDKDGKFLSVKSTDCHSPNSNCFGTCRLFEVLGDFPDEENRARYESYTGKTFEYLSCEEFTNAKLFFAWKDAGYYSRY